jgi:hypothetical protein
VIDVLKAATDGRTVIVAPHSAALARSAGTMLAIDGGTVAPLSETPLD